MLVIHLLRNLAFLCHVPVRAVKVRAVAAYETPLAARIRLRNLRPPFYFL